MPYIHVDRVVMEFLRERAALGDSYNTTIRKHLGLPAAPAAPQAPTTTAFALPGALMPLIHAGKLTAGDTLTWHRPRRGETHTVTVDPAGWLVTAGGDVFSTPDTCASAIAGHPCKGWPNWRTSTGETLQELRNQIPTEPPSDAAAGGPPSDTTAGA
jgi:hypothetical protein